ncbi:fused (3R)-hydroxyacyl-ACP dehydratase subunits HadA/HadB [Segniliparus rugosus]|uniref:(R)-hydratase n=1 Tax=Segniliparus rugosus (strain ATCC BAA-974 / DSM 45345 / CCUG 50838 / CIP 108380 / JCM 13579 / CDC 945) TaxID=679197 RepID=E5XU76_SEGRC|nr:fused (3R)-hydroxyacyl-ACP dehydratase subunits HadA/HadB [Segniliparus rugosus]EFV12139.1 hypothetical protein HMPREF9336_03048 [Segniliparus rugosus ATCC BAA-974]
MSDNLERNGAPFRDLSEHVGYHYVHPDYYEICREVIRDYAKAVQDYHPFHWDEAAAKKAGHPGLIAPLTFPAAYGIRIQEAMFSALNYIPGPMVQAEQRFIYHRPFYAGDKVRCEVEVTSFRSSLGADITETKNSAFLWDTGEPVLTGWTTLAARTGEVMDDNVARLADDVMMHAKQYDAALKEGAKEAICQESPDRVLWPESAEATPLPPSLAPKFEEVTAGADLPQRSIRVSRGDLINYAGIAADRNPIHWHDKVAGLAGFDTVIAHGMLTMGYGATYLNGWAGDPSAVKKYDVRFVSPVLVPADSAAEIVFSGKIRSLDAATRTGVVALTAVANEKKIFGKALATIQFA